jgi:hypothetical protein
VNRETEEVYEEVNETEVNEKEVNQNQEEVSETQVNEEQVKGEQVNEEALAIRETDSRRNHQDDLVVLQEGTAATRRGEGRRRH